MRFFHAMDLRPYFNNRGFTYESRCEEGRLTMGSSSFPAESIRFGRMYRFDGIPFRYQTSEDGDNIETSGQTVALPWMPGTLDCVHALGVSANGDSFDRVSFVAGDRLLHTARLALTDFVSDRPAFGDRLAMTLPYMHMVSGRYAHVRPNLWLCSIPYPGEVGAARALVFEDNPSMHIFAMTLEYRRSPNGLRTVYS
ncbi:hypothetical protein Elgi_03530 [Paenibacillus elgii]|uniref:hypothetical protein n=1 Tax=Paenibacillus elgii TaxID=189691 RepID=UPI002D7B42CB|nr:hypothetical protein Elgi_03530 [Paenibacillus elgii]